MASLKVFKKYQKGSFLFQVEYYRKSLWFLTFGIGSFELQFNKWDGKE